MKTWLPYVIGLHLVLIFVELGWCNTLDNKVFEDTVMRSELRGHLAAAPDNCKGSITQRIKNINSKMRGFVFDKEKNITSIRITIDGQVTEPPGFKVGFSRANCTNSQFVMENDKEKYFQIPYGESSIVIEGQGFPIRSRCIYVIEDWKHRASSDDYQATFKGYALTPHELANSNGKTYIVHPEARQHRKRVVGGLASHPGDWPWLVSLNFLLQHNYTDKSGLPHLCGASLIYPQWLLTAAHCFVDPERLDMSDKTNWRAVLGEHVQGREDGTEQKLKLDKIVTHPNYMLEPTILYDIALVKLSRPAHMSEYVNTIRIEPNFTAPDHSHCVTAGWGDFVEGGVGSEIPHHARVQIVPTSVCADLYNSRPFFAIADSVICASTEGRDSCQGDSGGPLACFHDGHWTQVGVTSGGEGCARPQYPGVYTRVNHYYEWIKTVIEAN
ncbi:tryptase-like isoform X1 [Dreissena polymorpha]|uniref:Peptidase S1 domain-containing protein n=2 Tax=Dreissena polymorpha TaxID=45954 RepID=A0A9D3XZ81_DREPO|nr:tryptase-like isoform X1 [Dreissena polymorpha]KAH3689116.1 hypothetical protein DPMN_190997 [Dreissena polymorpha]